MLDAKSRLAFALDVPDLETALPVLDAVGSRAGIIKVGLELFIEAGPRAVSEVPRRGARKRRSSSISSSTTSP